MMKKLVLCLGTLVSSPPVFANPGEYLRCANSAWNLNIAVGRTDPQADHVFIEISGAGGFDHSYSTSVAKNGVDAALAKGLAFPNAGGTAVDVKVQRNIATVLVSGQTLTMTCTPATP